MLIYVLVNFAKEFTLIVLPNLCLFYKKGIRYDIKLHNRWNDGVICDETVEHTKPVMILTMFSTTHSTTPQHNVLEMNPSNVVIEIMIHSKISPSVRLPLAELFNPHSDSEIFHD